MIDNGLVDPSPAKLYVFEDHERAAVMKLWSEEYHNTAFKLELQKPDSWKQKPDRSGDWNGKGYKKEKGSGGASQPAGNGPKKGPEAKPGFGSNMAAVRADTHSRFARHLQRVDGSKNLAELILFSGCFDPVCLSKVNSIASPPANQIAQADSIRLKKQAQEAKHRLKMAVNIQRRLDDGKLKWDKLDDKQNSELEKLKDRTLQDAANKAR